MNSKKLFYTLSLFILILLCAFFVSCKKPADSTDIRSSDPAVTGPILTDTFPAYSAYPFYPEFDDRGHLFLECTYDTTVISKLLGDEYYQWSENRKFQFDNLPVIYSAIVELKVDKEDFIKKNNELKEKNKQLPEGAQTYATFDDGMIELFYSGNDEAVIKACISPYTLYTNGKLYYFTDILKMSVEELKTLNTDKNKLKAYAEDSAEAIKFLHLWKESYEDGYYRLLRFADGGYEGQLPWEITAASDEEYYPFFPDNDGIDHYFLENTYSGQVVSEILGEEDYDFLRFDAKFFGYHNRKLPFVFETIILLRIDKNDFIKKNNEIKERYRKAGLEENIPLLTFSDEQISLFYSSSDEEAVAKGCLSPYTLYISATNKYYFTDVLNMSVGYLKDMNIDKAVLKDYVEKCADAVKKQGLWRESYEDGYYRLQRYINGEYDGQLPWSHI